MTHSKRTLAKADGLRKNRFLAALRLAGISMETWAIQHGSTQGYVSNLLVGRRENADLDAKVDQFIAKHFRQVA